MSDLIVHLAAVTAPAAQAAPVIVHDTVEVVKTVPAHSTEVMKAAQVGLLFLTGIGGSVLHQITEALATRKQADGWSKPLNYFIQFTYGILVAALASYITGDLQLTWDSALDFATNLLIVFGSSQGRYAFQQFVNSLGSTTPAANPITDQETISDAAIPQKAGI